MENFDQDLRNEIKHFLMFDLSLELLNNFISGGNFPWSTMMIEYSKLFGSTINFYKIEFGNVNFCEAKITSFPDGGFIAQNSGLFFIVYHFGNDGEELKDEGFCNVSLEGLYFWPEKKLTYKPIHFLWEKEPPCNDRNWIEFKKRYCREDALAVEISSFFNLSFDETEKWIKKNEIPNIAQNKIDTYNYFYRRENNIAELMFNKGSHCT